MSSTIKSQSAILYAPLIIAPTPHFVYGASLRLGALPLAGRALRVLLPSHLNLVPALRPDVLDVFAHRKGQMLRNKYLN